MIKKTCQPQARLVRFLIGVPGWEKRLIQVVLIRPLTLSPSRQRLHAPVELWKRTQPSGDVMGDVPRVVFVNLLESSNSHFAVMEPCCP